MQSSWDETVEIQIELVLNGYMPNPRIVGEFYRDIDDITRDKSLPPGISRTIDKILLREILCGDEVLNDVPADIFIVFRAVGYYDSGCTYGPPENCYPPEGDEERTMFKVRFEYGEDSKELTLTQEEMVEIFEEYTEFVDEYEVDNYQEG